jgi:hypothetical protein
MDYIPLLSGFIGAIIGATASIFTVHIQAKYQNKRELTKLAIDVAMKEHQAIFERVKTLPQNKKPETIPPPVPYIHFYVELIKLIETGKLNKTTLSDLTEENRKILDIVENLQTDKTNN